MSIQTPRTHIPLSPLGEADGRVRWAWKINSLTLDYYLKERELLLKKQVSTAQF
jgi:hypothetical protein